MTTTCEHGRERATCPECGTLVITPRQEAEVMATMQAKVDEAVEKEFGGMRPLTDVEEKWVRMKHPEMSKAELDELIRQGLPADVEPITRDDLPKPEPNPEHYFSREQWKATKKKRKISKGTAARNRRAKKSRKKSAR